MIPVLASGKRSEYSCCLVLGISNSDGDQFDRITRVILRGNDVLPLLPNGTVMTVRVVNCQEFPLNLHSVQIMTNDEKSSSFKLILTTNSVLFEMMNIITLLSGIIIVQWSKCNENIYQSRSS